MKLIFAWYDLWVGAYWDRLNRRLYIFPIPMVGAMIQFKPTWKRDPDFDCESYRKGVQEPHADCETDGHYLCAGCVRNVHRTGSPDCTFHKDCPQGR